MPTKPLIIICIILLTIAGYLIGGADVVSEKIEKYVEDNYKEDPVNYEKYTYMNAVYCHWTAKYDRVLVLLDKYDLRFDLDENREKSIFLRAKTFDSNMNPKGAKAQYQIYIEEFPEGKHIEKAKERFNDLKTFI